MAHNKNRKKSAAKNQNPKTPSPKMQARREELASLPTGAKESPPEELKELKSRPVLDKADSLRSKAPQKAEDAASGVPGKAKSLVRLSTCAAGMFLTFVLGLYLGSLLPGVMRGMEQEKELAQLKEERPVPPAAPSVPEAAAPRPAAEQAAAPAQPAAPEQAAAPEESGSLRGSIPREILQHIQHLEKDALSHPDDSKIWTELGNAYFDIHEPQNAISAYEHSLKLAPSNPDVLTDLGIMYRETRNYDKALECFRKAHQQDPRHINAIFNEGVVLSTDLGRKAEAARAWTRILDIDPAATTPNGQKIADMLHQLQ